MAMQSSRIVKALIAGGTIGGIVFRTLTWTGTTDLEAIKTAYNRALSNITTLTNNAEVYKTELARRLGLINDYKTKAESLQAKIDELEAKIAELKEHGTTDSDTIKQLQQEKAELQAKLDDAVSEEDYNALTAEIERLQGELTKANNEVASLKSYIDGQEATYADATAITAEDLQNETGVEGLYYTWETNNDNTVVNDYFNKLNVVDERNESPVLMQASAGNILNIGNMRAFKKVYNMESGQDFNTVYASKLATYADHADMTESDKFYNAVSQMSFTVTIEGTNYTIQADTNVALTPGGEVVAKDTWFTDTASNINF